MLDFLIVAKKIEKKDSVLIYPKFVIKKSDDLMIRGRDFYAVWDDERGLWSSDEIDVIRLVDNELRAYAEQYEQDYDVKTKVAYMWDADTNSINKWHKYCQQQMRDNYHPLDEQLVFSNDDLKKTDYASKILPYPLAEGDISAWSELIDVLYSSEERHKIEWCIGSIVSGESKNLQKFAVLYGSAGTGKSTVLNIIQQLFAGYYSVFDAKALGSSNNAFALEPFKNNPLVAIQHDGDLSRIEDNTRLNSLVSHETMTVNEKHKALYANSFVSFLFMGTNKPVKITDAKSGLIRRLIDISPTGNKIPLKKYKALYKQISFELGAIAYHCKNVYLDDPGYYDNYIPTSMLGASNDFYNFVMDQYFDFEKEDRVTLKRAWELYDQFVTETKVAYPFPQRIFKEELKNYFNTFKERYVMEDGTRVRNMYIGFRKDKFQQEEKTPNDITTSWIRLDGTQSYFDKHYSDCKAQYANDKGTPQKKWDQVLTTLKDIDTSKLHYVQPGNNHIVIDFDMKVNGEKNLEKNLEYASKFPKTYCELSKSGKGVHLHYIYDGDVSKLSAIYDIDVEIKKFTGGASLRRQLTKYNDLPISTISSGLPLKGDKAMMDIKGVQSERHLRILIYKNLNREIHANTKPSILFIHDLLEDAYESGIYYDVSDLENRITAFAANSSHNAAYCLKVVSDMKFKSASIPNATDGTEQIAIFDIEVFPNLFLVNWKPLGVDNVSRMINPTPEAIENLIQNRLIGFNCRDYDNHMLYARMLGYNNEALFKLSNKIIKEGKGKFGQAYSISYADVYDFSAKKQSLKKWEIELGIHHQELGYPWDQPVPEDKWEMVAKYCDNDVIATEAVFNHLKNDWTARQILADLSGLTVNDKTNSHTAKIIFGSDMNPKPEFCYRNLANPVKQLPEANINFLKETFPEMMVNPHGKADSILPYFEGYEFKNGKSTYRGEDVGEGGFVYAEPGVHFNVALLDVASMHPHSAMAEVIFGPKFTKAFRDVVYTRVDIKHESWDKLNDALGGKLRPYINKVKNGELKSKDLAYALKIAINSVYGLTSARFDNIFKDPRNVDNIVAKRGALFMIDLKNAVQEQGFKVAHIKTDSIKIPDANKDIIKFVMDFGKRYGYTFEHEATYDRMCLANDAVYIAKYATKEKCEKLYGYIPDDCAKHGGQWTATGTQFQIPYVFKTLFSKEEILITDLQVTNAVQTCIYLDENEGLPDVTLYERDLKKVLKDYPNDFDKIDSLQKLIDTGHDYKFIGKVGCFIPVEDGQGGGLLMRKNDKGGYGAVSGSKGYRWVESEALNDRNIDMRYFNNLVDEAKDTISKYWDFDEFVNANECEDMLPW